MLNIKFRNARIKHNYAYKGIFCKICYYFFGVGGLNPFFLQTKCLSKYLTRLT